MNGNKSIRTYPLRMKLVLVFVCTALMVAVVNIFVYVNLRSAMGRLDIVYSSNETLEQLSGVLNEIQTHVYEYLTTKSSDSLEQYYRNEEEFQTLLKNLNHRTTNDPIALMEKNIYNISFRYLEEAESTVEAKRARNISKYKGEYEQVKVFYGSVDLMIRKLNNTQFQKNLEKYAVLRTSLNYMTLVSAFILIAALGLNMAFIFIMTRSMTKPLVVLTEAANKVSDGDFNTLVPYSDTRDELGSVSRAFNKMIRSIRDYIEQTKENYERESRMKENELIMKNDLKEAQLRYLQAQINPHFLFNTLNAGAQLAMMEGAEKTCIFVENMADFFRYNVQSNSMEVTVEEEIQLVDNYIYILNVRFSGEIHFYKQINYALTGIKMPGMILQPIVENAVNHGIRGLEREGEIHLCVYQEHKSVCISIRDNGHGMPERLIQRILSGEQVHHQEEGDSTGIGMVNVISRLKRFYGREDVISVRSAGEDQGTEIILYLPMQKEAQDVGTC